MREEIEALLRTTRRLERDARALERAVATEVARDRRRVLVLVVWARGDAWRWN